MQYNRIYASCTNKAVVDQESLTYCSLVLCGASSAALAPSSVAALLPSTSFKDFSACVPFYMAVHTLHQRQMQVICQVAAQIWCFVLAQQGLKREVMLINMPICTGPGHAHIVSLTACSNVVHSQQAASTPKLLVANTHVCNPCHDCKKPQVWSTLKHSLNAVDSNIGRADECRAMYH